MEIYTMTRPSMPLTSACAPSAFVPVPAAAAALAVAAPAAGWASMPASSLASVKVLAAEQAPVSREHQVQSQAELAGELLLIDGINGTTGFKGSNASKRYTDGGSGVPPRGRPV